MHPNFFAKALTSARDTFDAVQLIIQELQHFLLVCDECRAEGGQAVQCSLDFWGRLLKTAHAPEASSSMHRVLRSFVFIHLDGLQVRVGAEPIPRGLIGPCLSMLRCASANFSSGSGPLRFIISTGSLHLQMSVPENEGKSARGRQAAVPVLLRHGFGGMRLVEPTATCYLIVRSLSVFSYKALVQRQPHSQRPVCIDMVEPKYMYIGDFASMQHGSIHTLYAHDCIGPCNVLNTRPSGDTEGLNRTNTHMQTNPGHEFFSRRLP